MKKIGFKPFDSIIVVHFLSVKKLFSGTGLTEFAHSVWLIFNAIMELKDLPVSVSPR